jgi:hypothetical protein
MSPSPIAILLAALGLRAGPGAALAPLLPEHLELGACTGPSAAWSMDPSTKAVSPAARKGMCIQAPCGSAACVQPDQVPDLHVVACNASSPLQRWISSQGTIVLEAAPSLGWVSQVNTNPGERVWLYDLGKEGPSHNAYCVSHHNCAFSFDQKSGHLANPAGSCVVPTASGPPPPPPPGPTMPTCAPGSPVESERFCDASLSFEERAAALVGHFTLPEKLDLWTVNTMARSIPRLNVKGFKWDSTCIHGGPFAGATVGPHAINQGATFDTELVEAMSNATADEMRANSQRYFTHEGKGQVITSLSCDGGPLANSAHDPSKRGVSIVHPGAVHQAFPSFAFPF